MNTVVTLAVAGTIIEVSLSLIVLVLALAVALGMSIGRRSGGRRSPTKRASNGSCRFPTLSAPRSPPTSATAASSAAYCSSLPAAIRRRPCPKETGYYWMRKAEEKAELQHQKRGGWHAFRRAWATKRKHLPLQDVMAAGGWRHPQALQNAYQHADGETIRAVMEVE